MNNQEQLLLKINKLSIKVFRQISLTLYGNLEEQRYLDHFFLYPTNIENSILILGINPSSADLNKGDKADPCFIHALPKSPFFMEPEVERIVKHWGHGAGGKKFTYGQYFKRLYELFDGLNFYPLWCNKYYNDTWCEIQGAGVDDDDRFILSLMENASVSNLIIINDLIPIKETNSERIIQTVLGNKNILKDLNKLFKLKVQYLKPRLVITFMQNSQDYFAEAIRQLSIPVKTYPFFKYLSDEKFQNIKNDIEQQLKEFRIKNKWSYLNDKYINVAE